MPVNIYVTEKANGQVVYGFVHIGMHPFLTNIDLNDVIFPFTVAIFGNCFGVVCLSSLSCSIFVHPFLSDSVRLVSSSIMTMNQEMDTLAVYFIDKPSVSVSVKFLIR